MIPSMDWVEFPYKVESGWFSGGVAIRTYNINELLGTKLRALYQRSKGRDLFDLYYAGKHIELDNENIVKCFHKYIGFSAGKAPSRKEFLLNLEAKENNPIFSGDMEALLRSGIEYDQSEAFNWVKEKLISRI